MDNVIVTPAGDDRVARVTVSRPKVLNALNAATITELLDAFGRLHVRQVTDAGDSAVENSDVGPERLAPQSVEYLSTGKNHVDHSLSLPG